VNKFLRFITVAGFMLFAANVVAGPMLGYVDVNRILREAPQAVESAKKLQKEFSPRTDELTRLKKQITDQEASGSAKAQDLDGLRLEFERKQRELQEDISIRKNEELTALQDRINKAVTAVADSEGYDLVVYSGLAYGSKRVDLTDKVIKAMGKPAP
jgi:outer membrane protein